MTHVDLRLDNVMLNIVVLLQWISQQELTVLFFMQVIEINQQRYTENLK